MVANSVLRLLHFAFIVAMVSLLGAPCAQEATAPAKPTDNTTKTAPENQPASGAVVAAPEVGNPPPAEEKGAYDIVTSAAKAAGRTGSQEYLEGKKVLDATLEEAAARTLAKNLAIRFSQKNQEQAGHLLQATKGVYDPVIGLRLGVSIRHSYLRRKFINRNRFDGDLLTQQFQVFQQAFEAGTATGTIQPQIIIDGVNVSGLTGPPPIRPFGAFDTASFRSKFISNFQSVTLSQQIPWGASFNIDLTSSHDKGHIPEETNSRPWTTDLSINVTTPLPFTKDWGPYGAPDASIKLAKKATERAYWDVQASINSSLLAVTVGYWDLVRAALRLEEAARSRAELEKLAGNMEKLIQAGRSIQYEKNQIDTELARVKGVEEDAWTFYLQASNNLRNLLDYDKDVVLFPIRYTQRLQAEFPHKADEGLPLALQNNPDLKVSQMDVESAAINVKFAKNQSRPDVKLVAGIAYDQNNGTFGYRDQMKSFGQILHPDSKNNFVGLQFSIPWGNKPALERMQQAEQAYLQAEKLASKTLNTVEQRIADSLSSLNTAKKRRDFSRDSAATADKLFKTLMDLWDKGRVPNLAEGRSYPAFEILRKNSDLLSARFAYYDALTDYKKAEAQYLSAQGTLPSRLSSSMEIQVKPEAAKPAAAAPVAPAPKKEGEK